MRLLYKTIIVIFVISFSLILLFNFFLNNTELNSKELEFIKQKKKIIFVSQVSYPPFEFLSVNIQPSGMMIELARWISSEYGFETEFVNTTFSNAQKMILNGEADVLTSFFYSEERDKNFDFTRKVFEVPTSIFVKIEDDSIKGLDGLRDKKVAIQKGDYAIDFLKSKFIDYKLVETDDFIQAANHLIKGDVDAVVGDEPIIYYGLQNLGLVSEIKNINPPLYIGINCMATKDGNKVLISILNKGIKRAHDRGILSNIKSKYIGKSIEYTHKNYTLFITIILFVAIIAIIWNIFLKRTVEIKTDELKKINEELTISINKFNALLNSSPDGIGICDLNGVLTYVSDKLAIMYGYSPEEKDLYIGKKVYEFVDDSFHNKLKENFHNLIFKMQPHGNNEYLVKNKNGEKFWVEVSSSIIFDNMSNPVSIIFIERDITNRKKKEQQLNMLVRGIPNPAWLINKNRIIIEQNSISETLGTKVGDYCWLSINKGLTISEENKRYFETYGIPAPGTKCTFCKADECLEQEKPFDIELFIDNKYYEVWFIPIDKDIYLHYAVDITKHKRIEQELQLYNKKLEDAAIEANLLKEEAEKANSAKGRFLAIISHELRTPLNALTGSLELIKNDPSSLEEYIDMMVVSTEHLRLLIDDITDLNKVENNKLDIVEKFFDIRKFLIEIAKVTKSSIVKKDISLFVYIDDNIDGYVIGDPSRLRQVFFNLVNNAIKFTQNGYIKISAKVVSDTEETVTYYFEIEDTGVGIAKEDMDKLFKPFSQIDSSHGKKHYGSGIGLYLSQTLINLMGSKIEVESEPGRGSRFYFNLTLKKFYRQEESKDYENSKDEDKLLDLNILIVDDNIINLSVAEKLLKKIVKDVDKAENGYRALEMVRNNKYDAIFMDIQMPVMDGFEATREIRKFNTDIKIFAMSANVYQEDIDRAKESGMDDFCPKPISLISLKNILKRYFN